MTSFFSLTLPVAISFSPHLPTPTSPPLFSVSLDDFISYFIKKLKDMKTVISLHLDLYAPLISFKSLMNDLFCCPSTGSVSICATNPILFHLIKDIATEILPLLCDQVFL